MTKLRLSDIQTDPQDSGKEAVPDKGSIGFVSSDLETSKSISKVTFNIATGLLTFIKNNGGVVQISGLPAVSAFGSGKAGPRGRPGANGRDGRDGRDGEAGTVGCAGPPGARGLDGVDGQDGVDGEEGDEGYEGYIGDDGSIGERGPEGPEGPLGPRGNPGPSCIAGDTGPTGPAPITVAVVSQDVPTDSRVFAWLYPTGSTIPAPALPTVQVLAAGVSNVNLVGIRTVPGHDLFNATAYIPVNVRGGVGGYKYKWSLSRIEGMTLSGADQATATLTYNHRVEPSTELTLRGTLTCVVTDMGRPTRPTATATANILFVARNPQGKVNGCIVFGSTVQTLMGDIPVEQIGIGDSLLSRTGQPKDFRGWSNRMLDGNNDYAVVRGLVYGQEDHYYLINGQKFTHEHPILVHGDVWEYKAARDVKLSDTIVGRKGPVKIYQLERIQENVKTVDIDVEPYDCYYVGDILVHNTDIVSKAEK